MSLPRSLSASLKPALRAIGLALVSASGILTVSAMVIGSVMLAYGMQWGPWVTGDSVEYFEAARNVSDGLGLVIVQPSGDVVPLALHPPLYSLALSAWGLLGMDLLSSAAAINFVGNLAVVCLLALLAGFLPYRTVSTGLVLSLYISSSPMLRVFTGAMSESLFVPLALAALVFAVRGSLTERRSFFHLGTATAGLAFLTRYMGLAVIVAVGLLFLLSGHEVPWRRRLRRLIAHLVFISLPMLTWFLYRAQFGPLGGSYDLSLAGLWQRLIPFRLRVVDVLWDLSHLSALAPKAEYDVKLNGLISVIVAASSLVLFVRLRHNLRNPKDGLRRGIERSLFAVASLSITYLLVLAAAFATVIDQRPDINERMLSALLPPLMFSVVAIGGWAGSVILPPRIGFIPIFLVVVPMVVHQGSESTAYLSAMHTNGGGYSGASWRRSALLSVAAELPSETPIISNEADALRFHLGRPVYALETAGCRRADEPYYRFGDHPDCSTDAIFLHEGAALVLFDSIYWAFEPMFGPKTGARIQAFTSGLELYAHTRHGGIYFYTDPCLKEEH